jgi:signal transduction histidine kinase/DNA-binding NarL/FixJ family response regulator
MKFPQLSLTTKIANYFLLLALITVGIVGGVAYFRAKNALQQAAFDRLKVAATLKEEEISRWFEDQQRDFLLTTQMPDVQSNLEILLNSKNDTEKERAYQVLERYLTEVTQIKPSLVEMFVLDRSNRIVFSTNKQREGNYEILANITYVEEVEVGANFAPIFYPSPVSKKPAITLAKPLPNRQGMILVNLDLQRIDRIVREKAGLGEKGESYLVGSLISKNSFIAGNSDKTEAYPDGISSPGIDAAMGGMNGYGLYFNYDSSPVLGVYRWLNEQDIALIVEICQDEAFGPARQLASTIVLVGLISVLGLSIGVNWLARQLSASRKKLEDYSHQLQLKAQEAETANRAKSLFLANMSHELRTPLNAILGFSQLMTRNTATNLEQKEFLEIINRSGEHLLNLINDVLDMSKIEAGKITLNNESFDLHELLQIIREMFKMKAEAQKLRFEFILAPDLPQYIVSDSRKIRQLLINLLSNAVKFTSTGGVTLRAWVESGDRNSSDPKTQLYFEVSDTGKGIAPEELERLFEPFVQTASGIKSEGGTGLGLAISRQFVELMGGSIQVTSTLGQGSTFTFDLQVSLIEPSQLETILITKQVKYLAPGQPDYRIAIADDRESNRLVLEKLLNSVGFNTRTATNGQEAIALWQDWQPHLIWMDMRMPVLDGYAATRQIKSQPDGKNTVIIALTASAFEEQREEVLAAGCDDFVRKPFTEQVIFNKLAKYLGVKYTYETPSDFVELQVPQIVSKIPITQQISSLPPELISQIHQAAIAVDGEQIKQLINSIPPSHQTVASAIAQMNRNYDFDAIIDLTAKSK